MKRSTRSSGTIKAEKKEEENCTLKDGNMQVVKV